LTDDPDNTYNENYTIVNAKFIQFRITNNTDEEITIKEAKAFGKTDLTQKQIQIIDQ